LVYSGVKLNRLSLQLADFKPFKIFSTLMWTFRCGEPVRCYGKCFPLLMSGLKLPSTLATLYRCPKSLEPMGILIIFLVFIYRLKLKVKRQKIALPLDERMETLNFGDSWRHRCMLLKSEIFVTLGRELQTVVLLSIQICWAKSAQTW
jgi:hypothetical protein